ncbi:MAG: hypothetical protein US50_C0036G0004 [Candidatus Nomurabacteria bacterium GW2011_GWB1_37_5]|uniref:Membrane protein 6-pyruvoyl-tetrahydropterin synthase-related domain-containing protein n=1 Tax=Candidatus Nomurabacteria bacterium GW2011_GWB1_37_5 TaxID=1618742 RepID=A0A0G0JDE0_9BACT|nr:MAG: hypothetical protein US50_C0036G0004 [Candidatus Nomurabacteria bacterium GW2011_GWB1_37_5]
MRRQLYWVLIFIIIFVLLLIKTSPHNAYQYVGASGDFFSIINPSNSIASNLFTFRSNLNGGYGDNTAQFLSHFSPYLFYEFVLFKLGVTQLVRTYFFLILVSCLGAFTMYLYLSSKGSFKNISKFRLFFLSTLYGFSPYFINYYLPGHFLFLLLPAVFPLVQLLFEKIIVSSKNDIQLSVKYFVVLSFIFLLLCTPFANLGVLAIFVCLMVGQLLINLLFKQINIRQFMITLFLFFLSLFTSNIWWLAPYSVALGNVSAMSEQSKQTIGSSINVATANSSALNIISGFPEGVSAGKSLSVLQITLLSLFILSLLIILISKKKINPVPLLIILITLFFAKGPNPPFGDMFRFLYEKIVYLQIIRRPASKLYWILLFFIVSIIYSVVIKIPKKMKVWIMPINAFLCLTSLLAITLTFRYMSLTPFNIPSSYGEAKKYLFENNVSKIILLPDMGGSSPKYDQSVNYHTGTDFLSQIWEFKKHIPNSVNEAFVDNETKLVNELANLIYDNKDICKISKKLNISNIVIRKDLLPTNYNQELLDKADVTLSNSKYISQIKEFDNNFKIFKLVDKCQSKLISTEPETEIKFKKINPTKFKISLSTKTDKVTVIYREKFDKSWVLHDGSLKNFQTQIIPVAKNKETLFTHDSVLDYANGWTVNLSDYCSSHEKDCLKQGDTFMVDLYIEYWPQRMFLLGITLSTILYLFCLVYLIYYSRLKK